MLCDQYGIKKRFRIWDRFGFGEVGKWGRRWRSCYATMIVFWTFYYIQKNVSFHKFNTIDNNCNFVKLVLYRTTDCCSIRDILYLPSIREKKKINTLCFIILYFFNKPSPSDITINKIENSQPSFPNCSRNRTYP